MLTAVENEVCESPLISKAKAHRYVLFVHLQYETGRCGCELRAHVCSPPGGFRSAAGESVPDGAPLQSIMGPPEGHRQARDEASAQAEDVRVPEGLRGENYHSEDRAPQDNEQVRFIP